METNAKIPVILCLVLLVLSLLVLSLDHYRWQVLPVKDMERFQQATGGLGMGAVAVPAWSLIDYDPRLQPVDESKFWPLPASYSYSPTGTSSVSNFREILDNPGNGNISEER